MERKRVVIVDDQAVMRTMIASVLRRDGRFTIAGMAGDPYEAREIINATNPDLLTLDVEMPRMNGLVFLEKIMRLRPMPVVMFSALTRRGCSAAIEALSLGAVDCIAKPDSPADPVFERLPERLYWASDARMIRRRPPNSATGSEAYRWNGTPVLIGASTGGVEALGTILSGLPANCPPIMITQHMPDDFLVSLVGRLDRNVAPAIRLATDGAALRPGTVYVAPGRGRHLELGGSDTHPVCVLRPGPRVSGHRPSVDRLFQSAEHLAPKVLAILLTGMGRDGAQGMKALRDAGGRTIAQSRESSVIFGMPRAAVEIGAATQILPLAQITASLLEHTNDLATGINTGETQ